MIVRTEHRAKVTSKGQVTIPKAVRENLGLGPGDEIEFVQDETGIHVRRVYDDSWLQKYSGYLKDLAGQDPDELIEEMRGR